MIALWVLYAAFVGVLGFALGLLLEPMCGALGMPRRWVWTGCLLASLSVPFVVYGTAEPASLPRLSTTPDANAPVAAAVSPDATRQLTATLPLTPALLWGWTMLSLILGGRLLLSARRLSGRRAEWQRAFVGGTSLLVSADSGPAVVGFARPEIVVPRWATSLSDEELAMLLEHERQHVEAGDQWLALVAELMCVAMPWNVGLWLQRRRLRRAIELDCDRRVLASRISPVRYGRLLLDVGEQITAWRAPVAVAFAERRSELGERIEALIHRGRPGPRVMAASGLGAVAVVVLACSAPHPLPVEPGDEAGVLADKVPGAEVAFGTPLRDPPSKSVDDLRAEAIALLRKKTGSDAPVERLVVILGRRDRILDVSSSVPALDRETIERIEVVKSTTPPGLIAIWLKPAAADRAVVEVQLRETLTREAQKAGLQSRVIRARLVPLQAKHRTGSAAALEGPPSRADSAAFERDRRNVLGSLQRARAEGRLPPPR